MIAAIRAETERGPILVVEDEPEVQEMLVESLARTGHEIVAASNGAEALARIAELARPPELIVLDWMMPVMNGVELLETLAGDDAIRAVPIVVLSAVDMSGSAPEGMVTAVLTKPVRMQTLVDVVERLCGSMIVRPWPPVRRAIPMIPAEHSWSAHDKSRSLTQWMRRRRSSAG